MSQAVRAIIIENNNLLLASRNKEGNQYFTLVGGRIKDQETKLQALQRKVKEETGLDIVNAQLVFIEDHPEPYSQQYIYLCHVDQHGELRVLESSEEAYLNTIGLDLHQPIWSPVNGFATLPFRTPQLKDTIVDALKSGFPSQPIKL